MIQLFINPPRINTHYLLYGITQCYTPPNTSECAPPNSTETGQYSINLPRRDVYTETVYLWVTHTCSNQVPGPA